MTVQIAIKLADGVVKEIDRLVVRGRFENRTDAVRSAVDRMLRELRDRDLTEAILEGYRRMPSQDADQAWAEESTRAMIEEEPW